MIEESVFGTFCWFVWDCTEAEFLKYAGSTAEPNGATGKFVSQIFEDGQKAYLWIKNKKDIPVLAHETLHLTNFWLKFFFDIDLTESTDEVWTKFHSYYLKKFIHCLK